MKSSEKKADQIAVLLDDAERASAKMEPKQAEAALAEADKLIKDPELELSPDREIYASRYAELLQKLTEVREARLARDIEEAVRSERAQIGPSLQTVKDAAEALAGAKVTQQAVDGAKEAVAALEKAVDATDDRRVFALKEPSFVGYLKRAKAEAEKARAEVTHAEKRLGFLAGPVALEEKAAAALKQVRTEKDLEKKRALLTSAASDYAGCVGAGADFLKAGLGAEKISTATGTSTLEAYVERCKAAQKSTELTLAKLPKPKPAPAAAKKKKK